MEFIIGTEYNRSEIHSVWDGQHEDGISTPAKHPIIFLFSTDRGSSYGYRDSWGPDGLYYYTGRGQVGDMKFTHGNRAIRKHQKDRKALLLFERADSNKQRFLGTFDMVDYEIRRLPDTRGTERDAIVFRLAPVAAHLPSQVESREAGRAPRLLDARAAAYEAANPEPREHQTNRGIHERSARIREYVLLRARGFCEYCGLPAPFATVGGEPFLEAHRIDRLSDDGPDHPASVMAVCPNCHREAHYGSDTQTLTSEMREGCTKIEHAIDQSKLVTVVAAAMSDPNGRIWLGRRLGSLEGKWEFPGGKVAEGEPLAEAVRREILEELGIELRDVFPLGMVDHESPDTFLRMWIYYSPVATGATPIRMTSHSDGSWYSPLELADIELAPADRVAVRRLGLQAVGGVFLRP